MLRINHNQSVHIVSTWVLVRTPYWWRHSLVKNRTRNHVFFRILNGFTFSRKNSYYFFIFYSYNLILTWLLEQKKRKLFISQKFSSVSSILYLGNHISSKVSRLHDNVKNRVRTKPPNSLIRHTWTWWQNGTICLKT